MNLDHQTLKQIWNKATPISGYTPEVWRRDYFGSAINWGDYGNRNSEYGWEVDHYIPTHKGGSDALENLRPLNWKNNAKKQDNLLSQLLNLKH